MKAQIGILKTKILQVESRFLSMPLTKFEISNNILQERYLLTCYFEKISVG